MLTPSPNPPPSLRPRIRRRRKILFAAIAFLAFLALLEIGARMLIAPPAAASAGAQGNAIVAHPIYGYIPAAYPPLSQNPMISAAKRAGEKRLLLLGDSFAAGAGASSPEKSFANILESRLAQWRLINAGATGWGLAQSLTLLRNEGPRLAPDAVLVAVFLGNDITDETGATRMTLFHGAPILASSVDTASRRALAGLRLRSRLVYAVVGLIHNAPLASRRHDAGPPPYPGIEWRALMRRPPWVDGEIYSIAANETNPRYDAALERVIGDMRAIAAESRSLGAAAYFVLIPGRLQADKPLRDYTLALNGLDPAAVDTAKYNKAIHAALDGELPILDLLPRIEDAATSGSKILYHVGYDDHFNDAGHQFAADAIGDWLDELESAPSSS